MLFNLRILRLESTADWDSTLDSSLLSHTAIKLNYLVTYSLVYQIKRCVFKPNFGHNSNLDIATNWDIRWLSVSGPNVLMEKKVYKLGHDRYFKLH